MTGTLWNAETALWLLAVLPAVVGAGLCLAGQRAQRRAVPISLATATAVLVLALLAAVGRPSVATAFVAAAPFALSVDALSAVVLVTVTTVTLLVLVFAAADVTHSRARFHGLMLLFAAAVVVTATATNLVTLLLAWEVMGATSYALIGFEWHDVEKADAGAVAFLTTRAADLGLYLAAGAALAGGAGLDLTQLTEASPGWRHVIAAGVLVAALGKAAQLPFSFWLSRAMVGPSAVSALLHSAAMVAMGGYLLLRTSDLLHVTGWAAPTAAWIGVLTALLLGAVALTQGDLKQLLAASTGAQLGFVVLAAGVGAVAGGTAHFVAHAATKALLFLAAGAWLTTLGTKQLAELRGVGRRWPGVGVAAAVGALALGGIAPLSLWATKDLVLAAALEQSLGLYLAGLAAAIVSAGYAAKILVVIWSPATPPTGPRTAQTALAAGSAKHRVSLAVTGPLAVLAVAATVVGAIALPPLGEHLSRALGGAGAHAAVWELVLSAALALVAFVVVVVFRNSLRALLEAPSLWPLVGWLGLQNVARRWVVVPTLWCADRLATFDDRVLDRLVDGCAAWTLRTAQRLGQVDLRVVDGTVEAFGRGMRRLGREARRPQTGQLHEYYAQATALLAVCVLALIVLAQ